MGLVNDFQKNSLSQLRSTSHCKYGRNKLSEKLLMTLRAARNKIVQFPIEGLKIGHQKSAVKFFNGHRKMTRLLLILQRLLMTFMAW